MALSPRFRGQHHAFKHLFPREAAVLDRARGRSGDFSGGAGIRPGGQYRNRSRRHHDLWRERCEHAEGHVFERRRRHGTGDPRQHAAHFPRRVPAAGERHGRRLERCRLPHSRREFRGLRPGRCAACLRLYRRRPADGLRRPSRRAVFGTSSRWKCIADPSPR